MMFVIPTWLVIVRSKSDLQDEVFRVGEDKLYDFLEVLVFNKREFVVRKEPEPAQTVSL